MALTTLDARVFALIDKGAWKAKEVAARVDRSLPSAQRSLHRLKDAGLARLHTGVRRGFATGGPPSLWTAVPGAKFPGVTPWGQRKTRKAAPRPVTIAEPAITIPPQPVTAAPTLAGTVAQMMRGKT